MLLMSLLVKEVKTGLNILDLWKSVFVYIYCQWIYSIWSKSQTQWYLLIVLSVQEVQFWDQGEGVEVALPEGWALPPAGQCRDHRAALPRHPQHKLPEQGETSPKKFPFPIFQIYWSINACFCLYARTKTDDIKIIGLYVEIGTVSKISKSKREENISNVYILNKGAK